MAQKLMNMKKTIGSFRAFVIQCLKAPLRESISMDPTAAMATPPLAT